MNNEPKIQTSVKDYSGKKVNLIKLDIILTIILFIVIGLMIYSLYPKFQNSYFMGSIDDEEIITTTQVKTNDNKIDVEAINSDDYVIYKVSNKTGSTKDITIRLNTYVGNTVDNTLSFDCFAVNNDEEFYAYFKKTDLKIYDKYEYVVNSSNSLYSSAKEYVNLDTGIYDKYSNSYINSSGRLINSVTLLIIYYDNNNSIINIEEKNKTLFESDDTFDVIAKSNYSRYEVIVNEAYFTKKES